MEKHIDILIKGNVKDLGYAFLVMKEADKLKLNGHTYYTKDDNLFVELEGPENNLLEFTNWCNNKLNGTGNKMTIKQNKIKHYKDFELMLNK